MRVWGLLLAIAGGLALAAPADASTLSFSGGSFMFAGTNDDEQLTVSLDQSGLVLTDATGTITIQGPLPPGCAAKGPSSVRCPGIPGDVSFTGGGGDDTLGAAAGASPVSFPIGLAGDDGNDVLIGGIGGDRLEGGQGADTVRPGFGADQADGACFDVQLPCGGRGDDVLDMSADGRTAGLVIRNVLFNDAFRGRGPDSGDMHNFFRFRLTDLDDDFKGVGDVEALGGDDFIASKNNDRNRLDCGVGDDLFAADVSGSASDRDILISCEGAGLGPDQPAAGVVDLDVGVERFFRLEGNTISFPGTAYCSKAGPACKLKTRSKKLRATHVVTLAPGKSTTIVLVITDKERARLKRRGAGKIRYTLTKPGTWVNGNPYAKLTGAYNRIVH